MHTIMKKSYFSKVDYFGKPARIKATVTDENGYISITGEIIPYRCKTVKCCGCIHEYISKAFPGLKNFIWLHLVNVDGSLTYEIENSLFMLANNDITGAQNFLHCSDSEITYLYNLVFYGLHKEKTPFNYFRVTGDGAQLYAAKLAELGLQDRRKNAIRDLYKLVNN